jgi:hypothetical protein
MHACIHLYRMYQMPNPNATLTSVLSIYNNKANTQASAPTMTPATIPWFSLGAAPVNLAAAADCVPVPSASFETLPAKKGVELLPLEDDVSEEGEVLSDVLSDDELPEEPSDELPDELPEDEDSEPEDATPVAAYL